MKKLLVFSVGLAIMILTASNALAVSDNTTNSRGYVPGQVLVKFEDRTPQGVVDEQIRRNGARIVDEVRALDVLVLGVPQDQKQRIVAALSRSANVEYAEPNYVGSAAFAPNDPHFGPYQWGLENTGQNIKDQVGTVDADIDGSRAWDRATGLTSAGAVKVAVLDSGIDQDHEDLSQKIVTQRNFTSSNTGDVEDRWGHGTHVAGIIGAITNNGVGVAGGCPECALMNGKVLNDDLNGAYSWYANGITWAADNGAKVINLSAGGSSPSKTLERAVNYAWSKGAVFVAAAGNSGTTSRLYPAYYQNAIAVAATDNKDQKASFSTYGSSWVDLAAPGTNVFSTTPNHDFKNQTINGRSKNYDYGSGTSMSSPMVAATVALVWSTPYGTSNSSVRSRLQSTADKIPGTGTYWSAGRANAANAVAP